MSTFRPPYWSSTDGRKRLSRGSSDVHTEHRHPTMGMPTLVPDPSTTMRSGWLAAGIYAWACLPLSSTAWT